MGSERWGWDDGDGGLEGLMGPGMSLVGSFWVTCHRSEELRCFYYL